MKTLSLLSLSIVLLFAGAAQATIVRIACPKATVTVPPPATPLTQKEINALWILTVQECCNKIGKKQEFMPVPVPNSKPVVPVVKSVQKHNEAGEPVQIPYVYCLKLK